MKTGRNGMNGTERLLAALLFVFVLSGLSATAMAATGVVLNFSVTGAPGCSPDMMGVMNNHAQAQRVRDFALGVTFKMPDSALATTCFDQALALSSRMGQLFADKAPEKIVAVVKSAIKLVGSDSKPKFDTLYNPYDIFGIHKDQFGNFVANTLINAVHDTVNDTLKNFLGGNNFSESITAQMGATTVHALEDVTNSISTALNSVAATVAAAGGIMDQLDSLYDIMMKVECFITNVGATSNPLTVLLATAAQVLTILATVLNTLTYILTLIQAAVQATQAALHTAFTAQASLSGLDWDALKGMTKLVAGPTACLMAAKQWKGYVDNAGKFIPGITLSGPTGGMPFFTYADLIAKSIPNAPLPAAGAQSASPEQGGLMSAINAPGNANILSAAAKDAATLLVDGPGRISTWKKLATPLPPPSAEPGQGSVSLIITSMGQ